MSKTSQIITSQQASQPIRVQIENPISTQPTGFNWLTLISTLLLATTAAINLFTARSSYENRQDSRKLQEEERKLQEEERQLQRLTLISELQKQYYFLLFDLKNKVKRKELEPSDYYRRYWIDREHEFVLFRDKFIDPKTYTQWMNSEKEDYRSNEKLDNTTYSEGYEKTKNLITSRATTDSNSKVFFKFMDDVFDQSTNSVEVAIEKILKNEESP